MSQRGAVRGAQRATGRAGAPAAQRGSSAQMSPWNSKKDPATGKMYYYNRVTGETTWERPAALAAAPVAMAAVRSRPAAQARQSNMDLEEVEERPMDPITKIMIAVALLLLLALIAVIAYVATRPLPPPPVYLDCSLATENSLMVGGKAIATLKTRFDTKADDGTLHPCFGAIKSGDSCSFYCMAGRIGAPATFKCPSLNLATGTKLAKVETSKDLCEIPRPQSCAGDPFGALDGNKFTTSATCASLKGAPTAEASTNTQFGAGLFGNQECTRTCNTASGYVAKPTDGTITYKCYGATPGIWNTVTGTQPKAIASAGSTVVKTGPTVPQCYSPCFLGSPVTGATGVNIGAQMGHGATTTVKSACSIYNAAKRGDLKVKCTDGTVSIDAAGDGCKTVQNCVLPTITGTTGATGAIDKTECGTSINEGASCNLRCNTNGNYKYAATKVKATYSCPKDNTDAAKAATLKGGAAGQPSAINLAGTDCVAPCIAGAVVFPAGATPLAGKSYTATRNLVADTGKETVSCSAVTAGIVGTFTVSCSKAADGTYKLAANDAIDATAKTGCKAGCVEPATLKADASKGVLSTCTGGVGEGRECTVSCDATKGYSYKTGKAATVYACPAGNGNPALEVPVKAAAATNMAAVTDCVAPCTGAVPFTAGSGSTKLVGTTQTYTLQNPLVAGSGKAIGACSQMKSGYIGTFEVSCDAAGAPKVNDATCKQTCSPTSPAAGLVLTAPAALGLTSAASSSATATGRVAAAVKFTQTASSGTHDWIKCQDFWPDLRKGKTSMSGYFKLQCNDGAIDKAASEADVDVACDKVQPCKPSAAQATAWLTPAKGSIDISKCVNGATGTAAGGKCEVTCGPNTIPADNSKKYYLYCDADNVDAAGTDVKELKPLGIEKPVCKPIVPCTGGTGVTGATFTARYDFSACASVQAGASCTTKCVTPGAYPVDFHLRPLPIYHCPWDNTDATTALVKLCTAADVADAKQTGCTTANMGSHGYKGGNNNMAPSDTDSAGAQCTLCVDHAMPSGWDSGGTGGAGKCGTMGWKQCGASFPSGRTSGRYFTCGANTGQQKLRCNAKASDRGRTSIYRTYMEVCPLACCHPSCTASTGYGAAADLALTGGTALTGTATEIQHKCQKRMPGWHGEGLSAADTGGAAFPGTCNNDIWQQCGTSSGQSEPGCERYCLDITSRANFRPGTKAATEAAANTVHKYACFAHYDHCNQLNPPCKAFCKAKAGTFVLNGGTGTKGCHGRTCPSDPALIADWDMVEPSEYEKHITCSGTTGMCCYSADKAAPCTPPALP